MHLSSFPPPGPSPSKTSSCIASCFLAHIQDEEEGDGEKAEENLAQEEKESSNRELCNGPLFINILSKLIQYPRSRQY